MRTIIYGGPHRISSYNQGPHCTVDESATYSIKKKKFNIGSSSLSEDSGHYNSYLILFQTDDFLTCLFNLRMLLSSFSSPNNKKLLKKSPFLFKPFPLPFKHHLSLSYSRLVRANCNLNPNHEGRHEAPHVQHLF